MSRFVNFSRFLNANRDAAQQSAERVAGGIEGQANDLEPQIDAAQNTFNRGVQAGTPTLASAWSGQKNGTTFEPAVGGYAPMGRNDVRALTNAQYGGPASIADNKGWGTLTERAQRAGDSANATGTAGGLGALMGRRTGLDTALVGNTGADRFSGLRQRLGGISGRLREMTAASEKTATDAKAGVDAARNWAVDAQNRQDTSEQKTQQDVATRSQLMELYNKAHAGPGGQVDIGLSDESRAARTKILMDSEGGPGTYDRWLAAGGSR